MIVPACGIVRCRHLRDLGFRYILHTMNPSLTPTGITANRTSRELTVEWNDGHTSIIPFAILRYGCPCAGCRGGHEGMTGEPEDEIFERPLEDSPATRIKTIEPVGAYALTIEWEDGHHFGIYDWKYLRKLCPCPVCRNKG